VIVARLIPLLLVLAAFLIVAIARRQAARPRSERTYRPRANPWGRGDAAASGWADAADSGTDWVVARSDLAGVRDAYSSAALDPSKPLYRCAGCQAYYHRASRDALQAQNHGRCAQCGGSDLRAVHLQ
jgi:hypothetical protein